MFEKQQGAQKEQEIQQSLQREGLRLLLAAQGKAGPLFRCVLRNVST